jgi:hypothetical protein
MIGICCGQLGAHDQSAAHHERARSIRIEIDDLRNLADSLEALADVRLAQGRLVEAERLYREGAALSDEIQLPYLCLTEGKLAVVLAREGRGDEALRLGARGERALLLETRSPQWEAPYRLGLVQAEIGRLDAAATSLMAALDAIDDLRAGLGDGDEPRLGFMEDKQRIYADTVEVLLRLGRPGEALEVAERSRARALVDMLRGGGRRRSGVRTTGSPPDDLGSDRWLERQLGSASRSGSAAPDTTSALPTADSSTRPSAATLKGVEGFILQARIRSATASSTWCRISGCSCGWWGVTVASPPPRWRCRASV